MKLKTIKASDLYPPTCSILKNGVMLFTKKAKKLMQLEPGQYLKIATSIDTPGCLYLEIDKDPVIKECWKVSRNSQTLSINIRRLCMHLGIDLKKRNVYKVRYLLDLDVFELTPIEE